MLKDNTVINNKVILITGGTGSFGTALTQELLTSYAPQAIRIYSRGEQLQYEMAEKIKDERLRFLIGDVRDRERLHRAMDGVDIVVHAAAIKQIGTAEYNPIEAVHTNVDGAINVIDAALDTKVDKVIAISTDKASYPINLYGATKMVAEKLFVQANVYTADKKTCFSCTRYGNVLSSRGSVVPLFLKQKEQGKLTITNPDMTRFWLTLNYGVCFVIDCIERMRGGEIFIPKIPSMRITDLANAIAPGVKQEVIGLRPGEKLHEMLIAENESTHTLEYDDYYVITPEFLFWSKTPTTHKGEPMKMTKYTSDTNTQWLTKEALKELLSTGK